MWFRTLFEDRISRRRVTSSKSRPFARSVRPRQLQLEPLEQRALLSVTPIVDPELGVLEMRILNSPPTPPLGLERLTAAETLAASPVLLSNVPTSTWTYGCTATSAGMIFGYYDRTGYPNMYSGPAYRGLAPLTNLGQGIYGLYDDDACSIIATENGFDGRVTRGHVDDYWVSYNSAGPDPWEGNWTQHTWSACTADFLGTNQWKWDYSPWPKGDGSPDNNVDGATAVFSYPDATKLYDFEPPAGLGLPQTEACHGLRLFAKAQGYTVVENYTQRVAPRVTEGFSFANYQSEIDAGCPVMLHATNGSEGHTMVGVGYDAATSTVYLHDTWDNVVHAMSWTGTYSTAYMWLESVTVLHLAPTAATADFGDAPDPYTTLLADDGARHTVVADFHLGAGIDVEADGQPDATAAGDDADEDGVSFGALAIGQQATITVNASQAGRLDAWIDFNDDGDWSDSGEQVFASRDLAAGSNVLTITVPFGAAATSQTFARFRFSSDGGLSPTGPAADGEVEDYQVAIAGSSDLVVSADDASPGEAGDGTPDTFRIVRDATTIRVYANNVLVASEPIGGVNSITIRGSADDDTLTVDNSGGLVVVPGGITFDGDFLGTNTGTIGDRLFIEGDPGVAIARETYVTGPAVPAAWGGPRGADAGILILDPDDSAGPGSRGTRNGDEQVIDFDDLSPIFDTTPAAQLDVLATPGRDRIEVVDGAGIGSFTTTEIRETYGGFERIELANKTRVTVNAGGELDIVLVDNPQPAAGLAFVDVYGNELTAGSLTADDHAADVLRVMATGAAVGVRLFGQGGDDSFLVGRGAYDTGTADGVLGPVEIIGGETGETDHGDWLQVFDAAGTPDPWITLTATTLSGMTPATIEFSEAEMLMVDSNDTASTTLDVLGIASGTDVGALLTKGDVPATVTLGNETAGFGDGTGNLTALQGMFAIGSDAGAITLQIDDTGDATSNHALLERRAVSSPGVFISGLGPSEIAYYTGGIVNLVIRAGSGGNTFDVQAASADVQATIYTGGGADTVTVATLSGDAAPPVLEIRGQGGNDAFSVCPSTVTAINVYGDAPYYPTFPGDWIYVDVPTGTYSPPVFVCGNDGDGSLVIGGYADTYWYSMERQNAGPADWGDAPDPSYPTLLASDGARHRLVDGFYLGSGVDAENDAQPNAGATGDGADDDGVSFGPLVLGQAATITVTASMAGKLDAWIDWNDDGDWNDPGEQIAAGLDLAVPTSTLNVTVPAGAVATGQTYARFRFSSAGGLAPTGEAVDGEVEDYAVVIEGSPDLVVDADDGSPGDANDDTPDTFRIVRDATTIFVYANGILAASGPIGSVNSITINGSSDDDTLTVDNSGGLVVVPGGITFNGEALGTNDGPNGDLLVFEGDPGITILREIYATGPSVPASFGGPLGPDAGVFIVDPNDSFLPSGLVTLDGDEQIVWFHGLSPVIDVTPVVQLDMLATPADDTIRVVDGAAYGGFTTTKIDDGGLGHFEQLTLANKATVTVSAGTGGDSFLLDNPNPADGLAALILFGHDLTGGILVADDDAADTFTLSATGAGVTATFQGQGGSDVFQNADYAAGGNFDLHQVAGPVVVQGGASAADNDRILFSNFQSGGSVGDTVTLTGTTLTGASPGGVTYAGIESLYFEGTPRDDTIDVLSTNAATSYHLVGDEGSDTFTIGNQTADFLGSVFDGTLEDIQGALVIVADGMHGSQGIDTLNVDASGSASLAGAASIADIGSMTTPFGVGPVTRLAGFAPAAIDYFHDGITISFTAACRMEHLNVRASAGGDTIDVAATTASVETTIDAFEGSDANTVTINGDGLSAANRFLGNAGNDRFVLNVTDNLGAAAAFSLASLRIEGNDHDPAAPFDARDRLEINDLGAGMARGLNWFYGFSSGDGSLGDGRLVGFAVPVDVFTMETVTYTGDGLNNDQFNVVATPAGQDELTFAPTGPNAGRAFLGGSPWAGPPADYFTSLPGVAGGGLGPDLRFSGVGTEGGTCFFGKLDDRLYVYAPSEHAVEDGGHVVIPGFANAYDVIRVTDQVVEILNGGTLELLNAKIGLGSFAQSSDLTDGLIVNAGFEAMPGVGGVADRITAAFSYGGAHGFPIRINGGDPAPGYAPQGDYLDVTVAGEINVFSDKSNPPVVSISSSDPTTGQAAFPLRFSSIENVLLTASNASQTVNLIGDNNDPAIDQNDNFVVVGADVDSLLLPIPDAQPQFQPDADGTNEFLLYVNGSAAIALRNVTRINAFGDDQNPPPGTPSTGPDDVDRLEITPYADNTPAGWGIDVRFDEGNPGADAIDTPDLLVYNGLPGVAEEILVLPSGPGAGQLVVRNAADGSLIAAIDYTTNTGLVINGSDGSAGDTDTLTLFGTDGTAGLTSGHDAVVANLAASGAAADPIVSVSDAISGEILYQLINASGFSRVAFALLAGNDVLTVDNSDGLGALSAGVVYDGGLGQDELRLLGSTTVDAAEYTPGPAAGEGALVHRLGAAVGRVAFTGVELAVDTVAAATLTVSATDAPNAIGYTQSALDPSRGRVAVDGFAAIEFSEKTSLVINALGGDDLISIENSAVPTGLAGITVNGGGPAGSDLLVLSGIAGVLDNLSVLPLAQGEGLVRNSSNPALPQVHYLGVEELKVVAQSADDDTFSVQGTTGDDLVEYFAGTTPGTGFITGRMDRNGAAAGPFSLPTIQFVGMSRNVVGVFNITGAGGIDTLVFHATDGNDTVNIIPAGVFLLIDHRVDNVGYNAIALFGFAGLTLDAGDGDDLIGVTPLANTAIAVSGGDPAGSDVLEFHATGTGDVIVDLAAGTIAEGTLAPVSFSGIERVNLDAAAMRVEVRGTDGDDTIDYAPTAAHAGQLSLAGLNTLFLLDNLGTLAVDGLGGSDALIVNATSDADTIDASGTSVAVYDEDEAVARQPVTFTGFEALTINGLFGDDTFNVAPAALPIFVDGGDPIGVTPGDWLNLTGGPAVLEPGPETDEGGFRFAAGARVSFDHIEGLGFTGTGPVVIAGTNGDDHITVIARDDSTHPALVGHTPGVRDFTVSINDGPEWLFVDVDALYIDGLAGDDDIVIRAPAPNQADWDVDVTLVGGTPSASDRLVFETPGQNTVHYAPTGPDTGTLTLKGATSDSPIAIVSSFSVSDGVDIFYTSSTGGIEHLVYDGENGGDRLVVDLDSGRADVAAYAFDPTTGTGSVQVNSDGEPRLGLHFQNVSAIGDLGSVAIADGAATSTPADSLLYLGTSLGDQIAVSAAGTITDFGSLYLPLLTTGIERLVIDSGDGDDTIHVATVTPFAAIDVEAGDPGASDRLVLDAAADTAESLAIAPSALDSRKQTIAVGASVFTVSGVEVISYTGLATGGMADDILEVDPLFGAAMRVDSAPLPDVDRVTSDSLPEIQFAGLDVFRAIIHGTNDYTATFVPTGLFGAARYEVSGTGPNKTLAIEGDGGDNRYTLTRPAIGSVAVTDDARAVTIAEVAGGLARLEIRGQGGDDQVTVDVDRAASADLIAVPIFFDGGPGADTLIVSGDPATDVDEVIYRVGPEASAGRLEYEDLGGATLMTVDFAGLEPVVDLVPAATLTVHGTAADNAVHFGRLGANGLITVDGYESIELANKTDVVIDAGAGSDAISIDNPAGVSGEISVDGGDPAADDRLIVNGVAAVIDEFVVTPTSAGRGRIENTAASMRPIAFEAIEHVALVGQAQDFDQIAFAGLGSNDTFELTPGATPDAGLVTGSTDEIFGNAHAFVPVEFSGFKGLVRFGLGTMNSGDVLVVNGTLADDQVALAAWPADKTIAQVVVNGRTPVVFSPSFDSLVLRGLAGNDAIDVALDPALAFAGTVLVEGGDSDPAGDVLSVTGTGANALEVDLEQATIQGGVGPLVRYAGVEVLDADAAGADLTVVATDAYDTVAVTPLSPTDGVLQANGAAPVVHFFNVDTFMVDLRGGNDQMIVEGSVQTDANVSVSDAQVAFIGRIAVNFQGVESLRVDGLAGADRFEVTPSATVPIFIDGGDPIGVTPGDRLKVLAGGSAVLIEPGPEADEGAYVVAGRQRVSFDHIEGFEVEDAGSVLILGTNGDDRITLVARDESTHAGADGIQDFTLSVNGGPEILFLDTPTVYLDPLAGSDEIVVRAPAPLGRDWAGEVYLVGGTPSASDTLVLETPGTNTVGYRPTGADTGELTLYGASLSSLIHVRDQLPAVAGLAYSSSRGGIEHLVYDGENGGDQLIVALDPDLSDRAVYAFDPSTATGSVEVSTSGGQRLGIRFQNLSEVDGLAGTVAINGGALSPQNADTVVYLGSQAGDAIDVRTSGEISNPNALLLRTLGVEILEVECLDGDDQVNVASATPFSAIAVHGGSPDASDVLTFAASGTGTVAVDRTSSLISEPGRTVSFTGVELLNVEGGTMAVNFLGTWQADAFRVTPLSATAAAVRVDGWATTVRASTNGNLTIHDGFVGDDDSVTIDGTAANDAINVVGGATATVQVGTMKTVRLTTANLKALRIDAGLGDDGVTVNSATAPLTLPLTYDGGAGYDTLTVTGGTATANTYNVGPWAGSGTSVIAFAGGTQSIAFENLEPFVNLVAGPLVVNATDAANAIDVTAQAGSGRIAIDEHESIVFLNKTNVTVNALGGDDTINVDNPLGLSGTLTVDGGSATTSDRLIVNGRSTADVLGFAPIGGDAGTATVNGAVTAFVATESVVINGQGGVDIVTVTTPSGANTITYTPGAAVDAASLRIDSLVPLALTNLGVAGAVAGTVMLRDGTAGARTDTLIYHGTSTNDRFAVNATAGGVVQMFDPDLAGTPIAQVPVATPGVAVLELDGLAGDDAFVLDASAAGLLPYTSVTLSGGESSAGDTATLIGTSGANAIGVDLGLAFVTGFLAGNAPVNYRGIEQVNLDGLSAAGDTLTVRGTADDDRLFYTPTGPVAGTFQREGDNTVFAFANVAGAFTINADPTAGGDVGDEVVVLGTNSHDVIVVDSAAMPNPTVSVENAAGTVLKPVALAADVEQVTVQARLGNDTIAVIPAPNRGTVPAGKLPGNLLVHVDGGAPDASDALVIAGNAAGGALATTDFVVVNRSRSADAGLVRVFRNAVTMPDISYVGVEIVSPIASVNTAGDPNLLILGPDRYEQNEYRTTAAYLGSGEVINVTDLAVFPGAGEHRFVVADEDYFRVVAAQTGVMDFQVYFQGYSASLLPLGGNLDIRVLDADGTAIAGNGPFGSNESDPLDSNERVRIPVVAGQTYYLHVSGLGDAASLATNGYDITITNTPAPVPYDLELQDTPVGGNSDSGRSQFDNVTFDNTPTILLRLDDAILLNDLPGNPASDSPPDQVIAIPFRGTTLAAGYRIAIFDEGSTPGQPATPPQTPLGYAVSIGEPGVYTFTVPSGMALADGSHFLTARVEMIDPATPTATGFGARSASLEIVVDTQRPRPYFGESTSTLDGLRADSDTGVADQPGTIVDRVTRDSTPTFWGTAEADTILRLYVDRNGNGQLDLAADLYLGQTVATPLDGTNQFPGGHWTFTSPVDLNDPAYFAQDGLRTIFVTAEDVAGNVTLPAAADKLRVFLDTRGPRVAAVAFTANGTSVFDPKPYVGPTPMADSLDITFLDEPGRTATFDYAAVNELLATRPGNYQVVGDANGAILIDRVEVVFDGNVNVGGVAKRMTTVRLIFAAPLPDDRFTLTIFDRITDDPGNALDGDVQATGPGTEEMLLPTGDGAPGGSFVGRFTVDSRPELGTWGAGSVWIDTNGNFVFDAQNVDQTNRDITYQFAITTDDVFAGNFSRYGYNVADGFDKLAAYGRLGNQYRWLIDTDNDGVADVNQVEPAAINGLPIAGDFDGNAINGDEVGLVVNSATTSGSTWYFDRDHDFRVDTGRVLVSQLQGFPFVGDFNGDGLDDLGTWQNDVFKIDLAGPVGSNGLRWDGVADATFSFGFIGVRERPVAADMNGDGFADLGLWAPDRSGSTPGELCEWYFLMSGPLVAGGPAVSLLQRPDVKAGAAQFKPVPFGYDQTAQFGDEFAAPLVGNFDPPVAGAPKTLRLQGTADDDQFEFAAAATPGSWIVKINGQAVAVADGTTVVEFDGLGGNDRAVLTGTDGDDSVEVGPGTADLAGDGYRVRLANVETLTVNGLLGGDAAVVHDSPGGDLLTSTPFVTTLLGDGLAWTLNGFETVTADAKAGGADTALLYGTARDETFVAGPDSATMTGSWFVLQADSFDYVHGIAGPGNDTAVFYDSPGDDTFVGRLKYSVMTGEEFYIRAWRFDAVTAHSTAGGNDYARLEGTFWNETLVATPDRAEVTNSRLSYTAEHFEAVHVTSGGGSDVAHLYDSTGNDTLTATPQYARLTGDGFGTTAAGYAYAHAYSTAGGIDTATLYDSPGNDTFVGKPVESKLSGDGFFVRAKLFDYVYAIGSGGNDAATIFGSAGSDTLVAEKEYVKLFGSGFFYQVKGFDEIAATASAGSDASDLYDSVLQRGTTTAEPLSDQVAQILWMYKFEQVRAKSKANQSTLSTIDAVDEIFRAYWS